MKQQKGFTLIEVLVALVLMAIALTGVAMMSTSSTSADTRGRDQVTATLLAQQKLEQLRSLTRADADWGEGTHNEAWLDENGVSGAGPFMRIWDVENDYNGNDGLSRVQIWVSWDNGEVYQTTLFW